MQAHALIFLLALVVHVCVAETSEKKHINIHKTKPNNPHQGASSLGVPTNLTANPIVYHNLQWGQFTKVFPIFWGLSQPNQDNIVKMYQDIAPSNFLPWNNQYYNFGGYSTTSGTYVNNQSFPSYPLNVCTSTGKKQKCTGLTMAWLNTFVRNMFENGTIQPAANTYYPIHFDPNTYFGPSSFGSAWCAYHDFVNFTLSGTSWVIPFAVIPDNQKTNNCGPGFNGGMTVYISHEWQEVTTDPYWDPAAIYGGFWDVQGYEDADKCAWDTCDGAVNTPTAACRPAGTTTAYIIQQIFVPNLNCLCPVC